MKLSIIIVNYNVKYYLEQCLDSIIKAAKGLDFEVIIADNNSNDNSIAYLKAIYPNFIYIENKENLGFAKANNKAINLASGEYVMLLNPDTILGESTLRDCIVFMDKNLDVGATGVKMIHSTGRFALESRRGVPTPFTSFCKMAGLCNLFPKSKTFGKYYMQYLDPESPSEIEIISGACMFIRKCVLEKCGLLDEDFFMYGEDIDLSYRLLKTGNKNYYLPTTILHYKGESTEKTSYRYVYVFYKAMLIFFKKHYSHYSLLLSLPIKAAIYTKAVCSFIGQRLRKIKQKAGRKEVSDKYLLVMDHDSCQNVIEILEVNKQKYSVLPLNEETVLYGHSKFEKEYKDYDYIVYSSETTSYSDMLRFLSVSSKWSERPRLATYHPRSNMLITEKHIWRMNEK